VGCRIYLAGPEVFLPDAKEIAEKKKAICRYRGLEGVFPMDPDLADLQGLPPVQVAQRISASNIDLMNSCDCVIANFTPFRGVSMDVGTAFEVGYMSSLKRVVLGYTNVAAPYNERTIRYYEARPKAAIDAYSADTSIEDFGFTENLMIECAVRVCGGEVVVSRVRQGTELRALQGFEKCVVQARWLLDQVGTIPREPKPRKNVG
jgi:nucleoside 2-deoxyribosyltransferase